MMEAEKMKSDSLVNHDEPVIMSFHEEEEEVAAAGEEEKEKEVE